MRKLSKIQLRKLIEATKKAELSDTDIKDLDAESEKQGGAMSYQQAAAAVNQNKESGEPDVSEDDVKQALADQAPDKYAEHEDGDLINTEKLKKPAAVTEARIRQLIRQSLKKVIR